MNKAGWTVLLLVVVAGADAFAIIGMPLTPGSYAGVARRTARRSAYIGAASYGAAAVSAGAAVAAPAAVPVLPPGCQPGVPCGGTTYQPAYSGTTVVYVGGQ
jgi:hypothetical protein